MRILIADDDPVFLQFAKATLRDRAPDHEIVTVRDGAQALEQTLSRRNFDVLLLDWLMPGMTGTQVCRLIRADARLVQPYVVFVTSRQRREEVFECLSAGADDLLTKPVPPDKLLSRIALAEYRTSNAGLQSSVVRNAIVAAATEGQGELVIRSFEVTARIFFHDGKVAWANVTDGSGGLLAALEPATGADRETIRAAVEECKTTGASLTETLVNWGLMSRARLRECVASWIRRKIEIILSLPEPSVLFLPHKRTCSEDLLFDLDVVLDSTSLPDAAADAPAEVSPTLIPKRGWNSAFTPAPQTDPNQLTILDSCMRCEGFLGVTLLEASTGYCHGRLGRDLNPDTVWAHIQWLNAVRLEETEVEDTIVAARQRYHLARLVPGVSDMFVYALVDANTTQLATARLNLKRSVEDAGVGTVRHQGAV